MKIVLNGWEDVKDHVALLSPALLVEWNVGLRRQIDELKVAQINPAAVDMVKDMIDRVHAGVDPAAPAKDQWAEAHFGHDAHPEGYQGLPADIAVPETPEEQVEATGVGADTDGDSGDECTVAVDADGAPYHTDWHSSPAKLTDKGVWRARRGRDAGAYAEWLTQYAVEPAEPAEAEPVATETHALPQDEPTADPDPTAADPTLDVDLDAVLAQALEIAGDQADGHIELLAACKAFMTAHSHAAFNDLKAAVAPDGSPGGKSLQNFSPAERRLMQAALAVYPKPE